MRKKELVVPSDRPPDQDPQFPRAVGFRDIRSNLGLQPSALADVHPSEGFLRRDFQIDCKFSVKYSTVWYIFLFPFYNAGANLIPPFHVLTKVRSA